MKRCRNSTRRARTWQVALRVFTLCLAYAGFAPAPSAQSDVASVSDELVRDVHARATPLDAHVDVLLPTTPEIYRTDDGTSQVGVDRLLAGGMATVTFAIQAPTGPNTPEGVAQARAEIDAKLQRIYELEQTSMGRLEIARAAADIERIHASGHLAVLIGFQNAFGLGDDLSLVDRYVSAGVRVFAFNHAGNNSFSDSSRPAKSGDAPNRGLSPLGRAAVARLNELGVVIDVSQLTPDGVMQTIELSRAPVIASHSAVRALVDEPRNLLDSEIDAIAGAGGVIHVPPFNTYVAPRPPEFVRALERVRRDFGLPESFRGVLDDAELLSADARGRYTGQALGAVPRATLDDYLDHIEYIIDRVGIDHVGIGTDFDHGSGIIGYSSASDARNLTRGLIERGYSAEGIRKIWSGNFMRVYLTVEREADN